ncbi:transposase [Rhizobium johnstonii]
MFVGAALRRTLAALPERYGKWKTVHRRFSRWCHAGVWELVFDALTADRDNLYLMIDTTIMHAHQQAASGKEGPRIRRWGVPEVD